MTGRSVIEYIHLAVIERVKNLLAGTDNTVSEIADNLLISTFTCLQGVQKMRRKQMILFPSQCRDEATRTPDPYVPNVVRYQLRYIPISRFFFTISALDFLAGRSFMEVNSLPSRASALNSQKTNFELLVFLFHDFSVGLPRRSVIYGSKLPPVSCVRLELAKNKLLVRTLIFMKKKLPLTASFSAIENL